MATDTWKQWHPPETLKGSAYHLIYYVVFRQYLSKYTVFIMEFSHPKVTSTPSKLHISKTRATQWYTDIMCCYLVSYLSRVIQPNGRIYCSLIFIVFFVYGILWSEIKCYVILCYVMLTSQMAQIRSGIKRRI